MQARATIQRIDTPAAQAPARTKAQAAKPVAQERPRAKADRTTVSSESKEQPREFLSGLLNGLSENFGFSGSEDKGRSSSSNDNDRARLQAPKVVLKGKSVFEQAGTIVDNAGRELEQATDKVRDKLKEPDLSVKIDGVTRTVRGGLHAVDAARDLSSASNGVLRPKNPTSVRNGKSDSEIRVTSWNLHHGTSQDSDGARPQLKEQIERLKEEKSDIALLQEVLPWQAQEIVEKTGKIGYFTQTSPRQGDMILVDPALQVEGNSRETLNHEIRKGDLAGGMKAAWAPGGKEPRVAQALRIRRPDGKGVFTVFNTHLSTGKASDVDRKAEAEKFAKFVGRNVRDGEGVIGGGDLNMGRGNTMLDPFRAGGYTFDSGPIDHLLSKDVDSRKVWWGDQFRDGKRLSDHPMISGDFRLES